MILHNYCTRCDRPIDDAPMRPDPDGWHASHADVWCDERARRDHAAYVAARGRHAVRFVTSQRVESFNEWRSHR